MAERRPSTTWIATLAVGLLVGAVEVVLAVASAALVFSGLVNDYVADGIALYLGAAAAALAVAAWRIGGRGVLGGLQGTTVAVLGLVATTTALDTHGGTERSFLTVVLASALVSIVAGVACIVLGVLRKSDLVRFVPFPVLGGLLAGAGWLLVVGGVAVSVGESPFLLPIADLLPGEELVRWLPAVGLGIVLLAALRIAKRPIAIPVVLAAAFAAFAIGMVVTGSTIAEARSFGWLVLGPFDEPQAWQPWTARAVTGADPTAILGQAAVVLTALFVIVLAIAHHVQVSGSVLDRSLDTDRELRDVGILNVLVGGLGAIPGSHAPTSTALAHRWRVDARVAGFVAATVPLAAVAFGAAVTGVIPRMILGGALVFLGLALIVEWAWDKRKVLPRVEHVVVLLILGAVIARGFLPAVVLGLVLSVVLLAVSYSRIQPVREVPFGDPYRSNVDRPPAERALLATMVDRVQVLRVSGFVFFGSANGLLETIRKRVASGPLRFLLVDLRRVSGVDSSAVVSFVKVTRLAESHGFELVLAGASDAVREQLARGGVSASDGHIRFEPDLDRGLQRCEDVLLAEAPIPVSAEGDGDAAWPPALSPYLERESLAEGSVLIRQGEAPDDVFVLESGRLAIEMQTPDGTRLRMRTISPGVIVGEVALYTGAPRTADVVAVVPSVVLRLRRSAIDRIGADDPDLSRELHRWLAATLATRLTDTQRAVAALTD
jgi:SulP family sulfate permease